VDDHDRLLGIYLRDHLAGSVAALELVERTARSNETNALGQFLTSLHEEIRADQGTLLDAMKTLGVERGSRTASRGRSRRPAG
jgi:hypothetical protein